MDQQRLLHRAAIRQHEIGSEGNLFMDVPVHLTLEETIAAAQDRKKWKDMMAAQIPQDASKSAKIKLSAAAPAFRPTSAANNGNSSASNNNTTKNNNNNKQKKKEG